MCFKEDFRKRLECLRDRLNDALAFNSDGCAERSCIGPALIHVLSALWFRSFDEMLKK